MFKKFTVFLIMLCLTGCAQETANTRPEVVTTTTMITDLTKIIAQDTVTISPLMQAGIDPHSYKARESDVLKIKNAKLVIYNGVHLEAKLVDIFSEIKTAVSLESGLDQSDILKTEEGAHDPHIWFSVPIWKKAATTVTQALVKLVPNNKDLYEKNLKAYLVELDSLQTYITNRVHELPKSKRVLVTAHDAFNYFANTNDFTVMAIQGISTEAEASTNTVSTLANFIATNKINAIFTESSISPKTVEALQEAVRAKGYEAKIGDELYSDSLKLNASYIETYKENVDIIVNALK